MPPSPLFRDHLERAGAGHPGRSWRPARQSQSAGPHRRTRSPQSGSAHLRPPSGSSRPSGCANTGPRSGSPQVSPGKESSFRYCGITVVNGTHTREHLDSAIVLDDQLVQSHDIRVDWVRTLQAEKARGFQIIISTVSAKRLPCRDRHGAWRGRRACGHGCRIHASG
jgi:hypothetical protein